MRRVKGRLVLLGRRKAQMDQLLGTTGGCDLQYCKCSQTSPLTLGDFYILELLANTSRRLSILQGSCVIGVLIKQGASLFKNCKVKAVQYHAS